MTWFDTVADTVLTVITIHMRAYREMNEGKRCGPFLLRSSLKTERAREARGVNGNDAQRTSNLL